MVIGIHQNAEQSIKHIQSVANLYWLAEFQKWLKKKKISKVAPPKHSVHYIFH